MTDPKSFVPLTPAVFHILLVLADGERHGYGIMQEFKELTRGRLKLSPGTLYRSVHRMLDDGLIEERGGGPEADERRRTYQMTTLGTLVVKEQVRRMAILYEIAERKKLLPLERKAR